MITLETRRKISNARQRQIPPMLGKYHSEETKRKIGKSNSIALKGRKLSKEHCINISIGHTGLRHSNGHTGMHHSEITKDKMSKANKTHLLWKDPKYREHQIKAIHQGNKRGKTKPERRLERLLNSLFPGEYKYVGNGQIYIGYKNPDFININGQKKIIEVFGDYWHSKEATGVPIKVHENRRINHFAKYGYQTLIIWQRELNKVSRNLIRRIREFCSDCNF